MALLTDGVDVMTSRSVFGVIVIVSMTLAMAACTGTGVGIGVSAPASYWGGGTTGPGVFVGGPVYR
jgi:hypothetical protein